MFLAICQGLGLAIAVGLIIGVVVPPIMPAWGAVAGAAPLGVLAAWAALKGADEPLWPALFVGGLGAGLAAMVTRDVVSARPRRGDGRRGAPPPAPTPAAPGRPPPRRGGARPPLPGSFFPSLKPFLA